MLGFLKGDDLSGSAIAPVKGEHSGIQSSDVFKKSTQNAITPNSPPQTIFGVYRSIPVMDRPRPFTPEEADALREKAKEVKVLAKASKAASEAIQDIHQSDRKINLASQEIFRSDARFEVACQGYKGTTARMLHGLRPRYAMLGQGLEKAEMAADQAIAALSASL